VPLPNPTVTYLAFPAAAANPLRMLDRQSQLHAAAFLNTAVRQLERRRVKPEPCLDTDSCLPLRPGSDICVLCAVDYGVDRHSPGFTDAIQRQYRMVGTVAKQALIDFMEANPHLAAADAAIALSSRLHNADLKPLTAEEAAERADKLLCLRAIERTALGGRLLATVDDGMRARLEKRGWAAGGYITPQGQFAREDYARQVRAARANR
jgi:hypothetical protein